MITTILVLYPAKNEEIYGIFHIKKIMSCYNTFTKKTSTCGSQVAISMWVTSGLCCGSVGQMGQQMQSTFKIDPKSFIT